MYRVTQLKQSFKLEWCCRNNPPPPRGNQFKFPDMYVHVPFEEGGAYCFAHVGMSVSLNLVQLITQERFAPKASNLVGRLSLIPIDIQVSTSRVMPVYFTLCN